ncbi:MAG: hypothetical protein PHQ40_15220 [Anaerolineaceae bacterium]|nr:hypothetical protein [Anaerolineaceae bacterium]
MKFTRLLLGFMVVAALVGFTVQPASAVTYTYFTGFQVQNLDATDATVTVNFIDQTGASVASVNDTIAASSSKTYYPLPASVPTGFKGSVVISSNTRLASVVNIQANSPSNVSAAYVGASTGSTTVLLPLLMKANSGYDTWFSVQNVGTAATNIHVVYSDGQVADATAVAVGASAVFKQATETHPVKVFSGVVTSSASPVAATVIEEGTSIIFAYSGFNNGSQNPVMPLINTNNSGYQTGVQIQNVGTVSSDVTVSYTPASAGTACTETQTIPAGQSKTFALYPFAGSAQPGITSNCANAKFIGSALVTGNTGNAKLVAVVNQFKTGFNGEAYGAFDPAAATSNVVLPLIMDRRGTSAQFWTGIRVMNVGTAATTVTCTFTGSSHTATATLQPNQTMVDIQQNAIAANYAGSGTCTTSGGKIVGVVNELSSILPGDNLLVYEAISQ